MPHFCALPSKFNTRYFGHAESVGSWDPGSRQIEPSAEWEKIHEKKIRKKNEKYKMNVDIRSKKGE